MKFRLLQKVGLTTKVDIAIDSVIGCLFCIREGMPADFFQYFWMPYVETTL